MSADPAGAVHAPAAAPAATGVRCENCGAPVSARYCGACGQRREPPLHSLWHFMRIATEDLTHADSRLWRTLVALLFRPGFLTAEFIAGRRAQYLPPVRLYLVLSVVFFLWLATTHVHLELLQIKQPDGGVPHAMVTPLDENASPFFAALPGESREQHAERVCRGAANYDGPWQQRIQPAAHRACVRMIEDNFRSLQEAYLHNMPRAMFVFLPLLAAAMMLMYWRPRRYYVEHLLLFVHNHAFVFLIVLLGWVASTLLPAAVASRLRGVVFLYILWYTYRSMRVVYRQGRALTLSKLALLSFFYLTSGAIMVSVTTVYSALTL